MTHILLTGAGFSRNWGGMLASDVFTYLLGCNELDDELRRLLWRDRSFEDVLAALQFAKDEDGKRRYNLLTTALVGSSIGRTEGGQHQSVPNPELVSTGIPQRAHAARRSPYGHWLQLQ